ncbi:MAG TPA: branched-chain amino acid transport system II carrier protein [Chondromyces sp.]|nr:branched-chain amino acid transport system II carrier protein [Chondromyces sp.]
MNKKDILFIGLMLFALFFGAGNLIFPPFLGMEAGTSFWPAIIGFVVTGVSLPVLAVVAIALAKNGIMSIARTVHPIFGLIFTVAVYLAIGPFFGIPRGASVAYEMGVKPFQSADASSLFLTLFMVFFFAIVYGLSLNPSKLVDRIGQLLTPDLLLAIAALCVTAFVRFDAPLQPPTEKYAETPFFKGFLEGYLTMDTIAALAFGIIVINALKEKGVKEKGQLIKATVSAGIVAGIGLTLVYGSVGWIGAKLASAGPFENGAIILTESAQLLFGPAGKVLLGAIVGLACLTTCIGLVSACSQFFHENWPKVSYKAFVGLLTLVSFLIANIGLDGIISISVPVLVMLYPFAIVLVGLTFLRPLFKGSRKVYVGAVLMTGIFSLNDGLAALGMKIEALEALLSIVPLYSVGLGWVLPAIAGGVIGWIIDQVCKSPDNPVHSIKTQS